MGALTFLLAMMAIAPLTTSPSRQAQQTGQSSPSARGSPAVPSTSEPSTDPSEETKPPKQKVVVPPTSPTPTTPEDEHTTRKAAPPTTPTEEPTEEPSAQAPPTEEQPPTDEPQPSEEPDSDLDPRFDTCKEANAHDYGPYVKGEDPEYDWYVDRDHDGIDFEPR
ncbi:excalibur calcium-binding domain-containing protein [Spirillospora sp. CA-142024]|uniref:excalibur calcium-binding domain-containing protein n=1 Tax=Spirillospora sp. CA-142024 TaxID=3240036 RepID=UPI003D8ED028